MSRKTADDRILDAIFHPEDPAGCSEFEDVGVPPVRAEEETEGVKLAKVLEVEAVKAAEEGRLEEAVEMLTKAIHAAPAYPSPYNNRAQVYRLQNQIDLSLRDLNSAIELSGGRGLAAEQACCQRGLLYRLQGRDEEAKQDFQTAAKLGNKFAQKQLVQMNPYAALCGQMLSEAFAKLRKGEQS